MNDYAVSLILNIIVI